MLEVIVPDSFFSITTVPVMLSPVPSSVIVYVNVVPPVCDTSHVRPLFRLVLAGSVPDKGISICSTLTVLVPVNELY